MNHEVGKKPLRVLLLTYTGGTGGVAVLIRTLLERFIENRDFEFEVCITQQLGPVSDEMAALGVKVHYLGMSGGLDLKNGLQLVRLIHENKYDIVDFHGIIPLVRLLIAISRPRVRVINEHGAVQGDRARGRGYFKYLHRILDRWTDQYVVVCSPSIKDLEGDHHVASEKITLIHNGVILDRYKNTERKRAIFGTNITISPSTVVVGTVRGLIEKMGIDHLIEAARIILSKNSDVLFIVVGDGPLRASLENRVKSYGLENKFIFLGMRRDIPDLLNEFDIFALPSVWEGLPISAIESLAAGVPVVGYDVGGNNEVIINNTTGILIPRRDPLLLADGILQLVQNADLRNHMGKNARSYANEHFNIDTTAARFLNMYEKLYSQNAAKYN